MASIVAQKAIVSQLGSETLILPHINAHLSKMVNINWFDISFWQSQDAITGHSKGRNITWFVGHQDDEWVLRHYYRGGLIEPILGDKYLYSSIENTRCYQELMLLEQMYQRGLPVPKPIAARISKGWLFYRADILIEKIPHAKDLVERLKVDRLQESEWYEIGATIAKFHEAGIYHSDLNAHNLLLDDNEKVWLIDFDKCDERAVSDEWQQANLDRLHRSFNKELGLHDTFHFSNKNWQWLLKGYQNFYQLSGNERH